MPARRGPNRAVIYAVPANVLTDDKSVPLTDDKGAYLTGDK